MSVLVGVSLIVVPLLFNAFYAALAITFEYPDILRQPSRDVLAKFRAGGTRLVLLWWGLAVSAVLFIAIAVLTASVIRAADGTLLLATVVVGVLAGLVQALGLMRWPFLVPYLARTASDASLPAAERDAAGVVFQSFNRYLGVAVGEHLGYALTGLWSILFSVAALTATDLPVWLSLAGVVIGVVLMIGSLEFVGPAEPNGWAPAGMLVPIGYTLWSVWLIVLGIFVLIG
ncbi:DUF4386 domain-containing protein [Salinibacterium sp. ZJ450]|uniref:DUF4386 domain-containing protein n=1 Tax=Salinibacterium sp. ZJ450 TaxID=2708338 RepID=UPI00141D9949|nr:DUF4386 domain-containing protein [Salinibacterium sp. ZJ450]